MLTTDNSSRPDGDVSSHWSCRQNPAVVRRRAAAEHAVVRGGHRGGWPEGRQQVQSDGYVRSTALVLLGEEVLRCLLPLQVQTSV